MTKLHRGIQRALVLLVVFVTAGVSGAQTVADAAKSADWETVQALIARGADIDTPQGDGTTALHWASYQDDLAAVDYLIQTGADVNIANDLGVTALWVAAENGSSLLASQLLRAGANPDLALLSGETPLMMAARTGNPTLMAHLLEAAAEVDAVEKGRHQNALMWAVAQAHTAVVELLLAHGARVDARSKVWTEVVKTTPEPWNHPDYIIEMVRGGNTPLLFAARVGHLTSAMLLLQAGADVDQTAPSGNSALVVAAHSGHGELAILLLEYGADANAATGGYTALHAAILHKDEELVEALLRHGATPDARLGTSTQVRRDSVDFYFHPSYVGATPYWLAARFSAPAIMQQLAEHGADTRFVHRPRYRRGSLSVVENPLVDEGDTTALMAAVGMGGRSPLLAVERFARIAEAAPVGGRRDPDRTTSEAVTLEAVRLAIEGAVDVNVANAVGDTALHAAAARGYDSVLALLIEHGAALDSLNRDGQTPLTVATSGSRRLGVRWATPRQSTVELLRRHSND